MYKLIIIQSKNKKIHSRKKYILMNNDELKIIKINFEFSIKDWKNNNTWRVYVISRNDIQNYKFENIENLICFPYKNEKIHENCFKKI